jgi:hypothetical protein
MTEKRDRLIFDLTPEDRDALERHRVRLGLRSHAETLRALIRGPGGAPAAVEPSGPKPSFSHGRSKTVVADAKRKRVDAPAGPARKIVGYTVGGEPIYR